MSRKLTFAAAGLAAVLALSGAAIAQDPFTRAPAEIRAGVYTLDPAHSKITWSVSHMGFSTYVGQFAKVDGQLTLDPRRPEASRLDVTVDANSVGTLNDALDKHLKTADFLDTAKFPTATFKATRIRVTGERTADITGDLTLHGVTRPVTLEAEFNQAGVNPVDKTYSLGFDAEAKIKRSDFGITAYLPGVGDEVELEIEAELKLAK
ncbi:YceI family protein [Phenylobacterium sp.]|uniref:YceI family protein n=1 Tax=Phenylobacterium sp. TaxID=1871053 RepID=UPI002C2F5051|nr:YceI family protein [Phenylobacterium sp.]HVI32587.1 YceI family protein [Phenylobacterium sp.]